MEYFNTIDGIDPTMIEKKIEEIQAFLERPKLELRQTYNHRLTKLNDAFRSREQALTKESGAFMERRLKTLSLEYLQEVLKLSKEYKSHEVDR